MIKDRKQPSARMKFAEQTERGFYGDLFAMDKPVWFEKSGRISPAWLSLCEKERRRITNLMVRVSDYSNLHQAYAEVRRNGCSIGVDKQSIEDFDKWLSDNNKEFQSEILNGRYTRKASKEYVFPSGKAGTDSWAFQRSKTEWYNKPSTRSYNPYTTNRFSPTAMVSTPTAAHIKRYAGQAKSFNRENMSWSIWI